MKTFLMRFILIFFTGINLMTSQIIAQNRFASSATTVSVIELYTSEGCSSCPPADREFSLLRNASGLWKFFVPMAFHVDYWNHLGWRDPMSTASYSNRQKAYGGVVATPGIKLNGEDANGVSGAALRADGNLNKPGVLEIRRLGERKFLITFLPVSGGNSGGQANVAILGFGIGSKVTSGENTGKTFSHDFVVLGNDSASLQTTGKGQYSAIIEPRVISVEAAEYGVAAWITSPSSLKPVQATGGMLSDLQIQSQ